MLSHESLAAYYKTNFAMMQHHKYSLAELDQMIPFEREVYTHMLVQFLEDEKKKLEQQKARHG